MYFVLDNIRHHLKMSFSVVGLCLLIYIPKEAPPAHTEFVVCIVEGELEPTENCRNYVRKMIQNPKESSSYNVSAE